jgi:hypothetical protein
MRRRIASNRVEAQKKAARGRARTPKVRQLAGRKDTLRLQFFWLTQDEDVTNYGSQMRFGIRWGKAAPCLGTRFPSLAVPDAAGLR